MDDNQPAARTPDGPAVVAGEPTRDLETDTMFARLGATMVRARWVVIGAWAALALAGAIFGGAVFDRAVDVPSLGPSAESMVAKSTVDRLKPDGPIIEAAVLGIGPYEPGLVANATKITNQIRAVPGVASVDDVYNGHGQVGADNNSSVIVIQFADHLPEAQLEAAEDQVVVLVHRIDAPRVLVTGDHLAQRAFADRATADAATGESVALVVLVIVLIAVFGGFTGAGVTLAVALVVIAGGLLGLLGFSAVTSVSQFAVNVVTLFGIGLAVDYTVLLIFRFRELRAAADTEAGEVLPDLMATAGRVVLISGLAVAAAMGGLAVFGEPLLAAMALGGAIVVLLAMAVALTLVPALLAVAGDRIPPPGGSTWVTAARDAVLGALRRTVVAGWSAVRRRRPERASTPVRARRPAPPPVRRRPAAGPPGAADTLLARLAGFAQRRPGPVAAVTTVGLLGLAALFLGANLANSDARAMPRSMEVRQGYDAVQALFNNKLAAPVTVVASVAPDNADLVFYLNHIERLPNVHRVAIRPDVPRTATVIDVTPLGDTAGPQSRALVRDLRGLTTPFPVTVGGAAAELVDYQSSVATRLPVVALVLLITTGVLLFALTGSVIIPLKALLLNLLTLGATLGVLVITFQWGWGGWLLGFQSWGAIDLTTPLLLFIFVFGLTMDYEVFLLARITQEWERTHDNDRAVLIGIRRTGPVVTTAALSIGVVFLGFLLGGLTAVKEVGFGMAVAILLDVTVVRGLLLPAAMSLLGDLNWWAPAFLRRRGSPAPTGRPTPFAAAK